MSEVVESSAQEVRLGDEKEEEKLRAQQTEQQGELKFKTVFENANDCMFVLDVSGRILDVNKKAMDIFGRTKEELYGKHFSRVNAVSPKDVPRLVSGLAEVFAGKKSSLMLNVRSKMGREIALDCSGSLMKVGDKPSVLVIARDISERQRMEKALKASEERHRNLFELAPDGILTSDLKGNVTSVNEAFLRITGFSKEEIVGKHFTKLPTIREMDMNKYMRLFFSFLRGKKIGPVEFTYRRKDGTLAWGDAHPGLLKEKGKVVGFLVVLRDITERKKMEEALRESEEKYRAQFEESLDAILVADAETGIIIDCNRAASELVGREKSELVGRHQRVLHPPEEIEGEFSRTYKQHLREKEGHVLETQVITKRGEIRDVAIKANVFELRGKKLIQGVFRDITERKRAEDALRRSENKSGTLLENLPQKIFFKDKNSVYISCNENYARDLKIHSDEITGRTDFDFYPKELAEKYRADDNRIMESGNTEDIEEEYIQDGQKVFVHTVKTPVKDEKGNVVGILGIFWDITERKKAEERIRESEEKYRNLFENARDLIITTDLEGNITSANRMVEEYGYDQSDIIGKNWFNLAPKESLQQFRDGFSKLAHGKPNEGEIKIFSRRRQDYAITEYRSNPVIQNNKVVGIQTIVRDITERKEMEEKLKQYSEDLEELVKKKTEELLESEKRYSVLVEEAGDGVIILQDGKVVFTNKKAAETIGYSKDEMIGLSLEKLVDEGSLPLAKEMYERNLHGETPTTFEVKWIAKTGERIPFEVSGARLHYNGRPAVLRVVRDIRERKRMEEQRLRLEKLATIGELATMVGHDLRNPLQSIENATYYLNNELTNLSTSVPMSPKTTEMLQVINDSVNYADKIIRDLKDFSATKAPALKETNINTLVTETLSQVQIPENIELYTEPGYLPEIKADKDQLKRVFLNLTTNAIQAMEKGGTLIVSTKKTEGWIEVSFKDTGVGISKENIEKIFTLFFTTRAKGMGMGLPICKKFVEGHGGKIEVESQVGKGTTFTVKLPILQDNGGEKQ